jgi:hypothetical protein
MGSGWKGRACRAVMRVARRVGGRGDSVGWVLVSSFVVDVQFYMRGTYCPSPLRMRWLCVLFVRGVCFRWAFWRLRIENLVFVN